MCVWISSPLLDSQGILCEACELKFMPFPFLAAFFSLPFLTQNAHNV